MLTTHQAAPFRAAAHKQSPVQRTAIKFTDTTRSILPFVKAIRFPYMVAAGTFALRRFLRRRPRGKVLLKAKGDGSFLDMLAAVRRSVLTAILGSHPVDEEETEEATEEPESQQGTETVHPQSGEGWLESTRDAAGAAVAVAVAAAASAAGALSPQAQEEDTKLEPVQEDSSSSGPPTPVLPPFLAPAPLDTGTEAVEPTEVKVEPEVVTTIQPTLLDEKPEDHPPPIVPGMDEANLVVRVNIPVKLAAPESSSEGVARLMAMPGGDILALMAQDGWEVIEVDRANGIYDLLLPAVRYELAAGTVTIPPPRFRTCVRESVFRSGDFYHRLSGDLVLQNGEGIFTLELGFPFYTKFSISAAGWTRAAVGWQGDAIGVSNAVEVGIKVPRVPGLTGLLEHFVQNYGDQSTYDCAVALAKGADSLPPPSEGLPDWLASSLGAVAEGWNSVVGNIPQLPELELPELPDLLGSGEGPAAIAVENHPSASSSSAAPPPSLIVEEVTAETVEEPFDPTPVPTILEAGEEEEEAPPPQVPGMDEANLMVRVSIPRKLAIPESNSEGVARLMSLPGGDILSLMAQEGWEVHEVDRAQGVYELLLPQVRYELPGGVVTIPQPKFLTTVRESVFRNGDFCHRLSGDLVLQNGEGIFTLELGFPFRTKFSISAAGWTRAAVGWQGEAVTVSNEVEVGIKVPKVPGLSSILEVFVKSYGDQSTQECADALAKGADSLPPSEGLPEWLAQISGAVAEGWNSVIENLPELPGTSKKT